MKKKIVTLVLAGMMALSMTACGGKSDGETSAPKKEEAVKEPTDLTGTWKSEENEGTWIKAEISGDTISINWVTDGGDTESIYWIGTYTAPDEYVEEYIWTSERDKEKTDMALLASTDDTKEFSYSDKTISYEASMMGTTTKVKLTKE